MNKFAIRLLTLAIFSVALVAAPVVSKVYAAPDNDPPPPPSARARRRKASEVRPGIRGHRIRGRLSRRLRHDLRPRRLCCRDRAVEGARRDDSAAVANLIGYSYRKLGDYKVAQIWYERALKADPNHVKTWQYYGLWQVEQGNRDPAQYHLNRIAALDRHRQRGISLAGRGAGKAAGHRPGLLSSLTPLQPAQPRRVAPALLCRVASGNIPAEIFGLPRSLQSSDISGDRAHGTMAATRDRIHPQLDRIPAAGLAAARLHRRHRASRQGHRGIRVRPRQSRHRRKAHPTPPVPDRVAFEEFHRGRNHEAARAASNCGWTIRSGNM